MPAAKTPTDAVNQYLVPFKDAIRCIAHGSLLTTRERFYEISRTYPISLNRNDPLRLRSSPAIYLAAGQQLRVVADGETTDQAYRIRIVEYWYQFLLPDRIELLSYHWTPETSVSGQTTHPHLHIAAAMLSPTAPVFPGTFHKKHLPSGLISIESVVRFAIEELGVPPLRRDWSDILDRGQRQFDADRLG